MNQWQFINISNTQYIIKYVNVCEKSIVCYLSDLKSLWKEEITYNDLDQRAKEKNPLIEHESEIIIKTLQSPIGNAKIDIKQEEDTTVLSFKYYISEFPFNFYWQLKLCPDDESFELLTSNIFSSLIILNEQNKELKEIIRKKDLEIEQYKCEGATLLRKTLETEPFNDHTFRNCYGKESNKTDFIRLLEDNSTKYKVYEMCKFDRTYLLKSPNHKLTEFSSETTPTEVKLSNISKRSPSKAAQHIKKKRDNLYLKKLQPNTTKMLYEESESSEEFLKSSTLPYEEQPNKVQESTTEIAGVKKQKIKKFRRDLDF